MNQDFLTYIWEMKRKYSLTALALIKELFWTTKTSQGYYTLL